VSAGLWSLGRECRRHGTGGDVPPKTIPRPAVDSRQQVGCPHRRIAAVPNRDDDPQYIVRLIGQVIYVSLATVKLVGALPDLGLPKPAAEAAASRS
jgi:hypothetical protein